MLSFVVLGFLWILLFEPLFGVLSIALCRFKDSEVPQSRGSNLHIVARCRGSDVFGWLRLPIFGLLEIPTRSCEIWRSAAFRPVFVSICDLTCKGRGPAPIYRIGSRFLVRCESNLDSLGQLSDLGLISTMIGVDFSWAGSFFPNSEFPDSNS